MISPVVPVLMAARTSMRSDVVPDRYPSIDVFAGREDHCEVVAVLDRLGYAACLRPTSRPPVRQRTDRVPHAAIVYDDAAESLALCADMADHCPVILVSGQTSFEFRLAAAQAGVTALLHWPVNPIELAEWLDSSAARRDQDRRRW